jgi:AGZA family xanthine/uracil permease-like MFS transporter
VMPCAFSITEGIAFGFISYALLKLVSFRAVEVHALVYLFAVLFVMRYIFL